MADLFGSSDDDDANDGGGVRPAACGPFAFHAGTEDELVRCVEADAPFGDAAAVLGVVDAFCRTRHWMMHVGPEKGAIAVAALAAAPATGDLCVEVGSYCGYSAVALAAPLGRARGGARLLSLEAEPACVAFARRVVARAGLAETVAVARVLPGETAAAAVARLRPGRRIRFLFLDHAKDAYLSDLLALEPLLAPDAVVVADNVLAVDGGASLAGLEAPFDAERLAIVRFEEKLPHLETPFEKCPPSQKR